jgi:DNA-binding CsgD family transcriptional regulator
MTPDRSRPDLYLSYCLSDVSDRSAYLCAASAALAALVPGDSVGWVGAHLKTGAVEICGFPPESSRPEIVEAVARTRHVHPMLVAYSANLNDLSPRRISDLISERAWRSHQVYGEVFVPLAAVHQLTVMLAPFGDGVWNGWAINRSGDDFTDAELALARQLQPMLMILNRLSCMARPADITDRREEARERAGLTHREHEVIQLLGEGLSAVSIARVHRTSPATVRKHLEHIYTKLGQHDRLLAVQEARRRGLIAGSPS